jgi:hypothetical protein
MKYAFFVFLFLAVLSFTWMRMHQYGFEQSTGSSFNVMDFELPGSVDNFNNLLKKWSSEEEKAFILKQLWIDYFFMSTLFPALFILCLWARKMAIEREKLLGHKGRYQGMKVILSTLAGMQLLAWVFDIVENVRLTTWINQGYAENLFLFEDMVRLKFFFGIVGALTAMSVIAFTRYRKNQPLS